MPARPDLIERTFASLVGAKRAIVHFYNATCACFRDVVFSKSKEETIAMSVQAAKTARHFAEQYRTMYGTKFRPAFAAETFSQTEPDFIIDVCTAVREAWGPLDDGPLIFNLAATVEVAPPNHYADQVRDMARFVSA